MKPQEQVSTFTRGSERDHFHKLTEISGMCHSKAMRKLLECAKAELTLSLIKDN